MTKKRVIRRLREKLVKIQVYKATASKQYGNNISNEMFGEDLDFLSSVLYLIESNPCEIDLDARPN